MRTDDAQFSMTRTALIILHYMLTILLLLPGLAVVLACLLLIVSNISNIKVTNELWPQSGQVAMLQVIFSSFEAVSRMTYTERRLRKA